MKISQNFVDFSEYMNFKKQVCETRKSVHHQAENAAKPAHQTEKLVKSIRRKKNQSKIFEKKSWIYFRKNMWQHVKKRVLCQWDQTGTYALKLLVVGLVPVHHQAENAAKPAHQTEKLVKSSRLQFSVERWRSNRAPCDCVLKPSKNEMVRRSFVFLAQELN